MYRLVLLHMWPPILFSDFSETQCQMGTCIYSIQFEWRHIIVLTPVKDEFHKFFLKQILGQRKKSVGRANRIVAIR